MAKFAVLSVRDIVADTYGRPFFAPNVPSGARSLRSEVNNPQAGMLHTNPADFQLFELGVFDDQTCQFELLPQPHQVLGSLDVLRDERQESVTG